MDVDSPLDRAGVEESLEHPIAPAGGPAPGPDQDHRFERGCDTFSVIQLRADVVALGDRLDVPGRHPGREHHLVRQIRELRVEQAPVRAVGPAVLQEVVDRLLRVPHIMVGIIVPHHAEDVVADRRVEGLDVAIGEIEGGVLRELESVPEPFPPFAHGQFVAMVQEAGGPEHPDRTPEERVLLAMPPVVELEGIPSLRDGEEEIEVDRKQVHRLVLSQSG